MVGVQDGLDFGDANPAQQLQHVAGAEVDEHGAVAVLEHVDVAGVAQQIEVW